MSMVKFESDQFQSLDHLNQYQPVANFAVYGSAPINEPYCLLAGALVSVVWWTRRDAQNGVTSTYYFKNILRKMS